MKGFWKGLWSVVQMLLKAVLAAAIFLYSWNYLSPYFRKDRNKEGDYFRNLPANSVDVLALGSSHMQYAFNPAVFYTESGYYSYVLGSPCQPMEMTYSLLQEALKTQHPAVVVIDVFTLLQQSIVCYGDGMYYIAIQETTGDTWAKAADSVPEQEKQELYKYDFLMNHSNWKTMDLNNLSAVIADAKPAAGYDYSLGYVRQEPEQFTYMPLITYERQNTVTLSDHEKQELDQIIDLCQQNGIKPLFVKTPYIIDQENTDKLDAIWDYLDSRSVEHIDFIQKAAELGWFIGMDGDTWHNNSWGAQIITKYLAQTIKEENLVTSHTDSEVWDGLLKDARHVAAYSLMNPSNVDIYHMLAYAAKYPCLQLVRYNGHRHTTILGYENQILQDAGCNHDFVADCNQDYYAVIEDGKVVQDGSQPFDMTYAGLQISLGKDEIKINGDTVTPEGEMSICFMARDLSWMNPISIDYSSRFFWKNGCNAFDCSGQ